MCPVLDTLELESEVQRLQIQEYYVRLTQEYEIRSNRMGWWLYHLNAVRTTFNILLPALLALQNAGTLSAHVMWITWALSVCVSLSTGYIEMFRLNVLYETFTRAYELLKIEGWCFFTRSGRYEKFESHNAALPSFLCRISSLRRKFLDVEFPPKQDEPDESLTEKLHFTPPFQKNTSGLQHVYVPSNAPEEQSRAHNGPGQISRVTRTLMETPEPVLKKPHNQTRPSSITQDRTSKQDSTGDPKHEHMPRGPSGPPFCDSASQQVVEASGAYIKGRFKENTHDQCTSAATGVLATIEDLEYKSDLAKKHVEDLDV